MSRKTPGFMAGSLRISKRVRPCSLHKGLRFADANAPWKNLRRFQTQILQAKSERASSSWLDDCIRGEPAGSLFFFCSRPSREEIGFRPLRWATKGVAAVNFVLGMEFHHLLKKVDENFPFSSFE
ncbi:MAG TPA: hypothetical protein IAB51_10090 [Candidatus Merdivicinus excrementipullorum]|uniref:Uncharacterized protein n=1 Tax=Candidatus Merdivicinus excrementipullorum TaxID=2840867 RepID=A0A9D1K0B5_9FIRM|nr:hypothetical protein [Candidatus Merdivicinus excrementipullorum]